MEHAHSHDIALEEALDFVNTRELDRDGYVDRLPDLGSALGWLEAHGLIHQEARRGLLASAAGTAGDSSVPLRRLRGLRESLRELLDATYERRAPAAAALAQVNRALSRRPVPELVAAGDAIALDHRHDDDPIDEAMARLAEPIAREVAGATGRLRVCANDDCRWVFRDESPSGRRKWCSMAVCGNRAKVARHRQRQRAQPADEQEAGPPPQ